MAKVSLKALNDNQLGKFKKIKLDNISFYDTNMFCNENRVTGLTDINEANIEKVKKYPNIFVPDAVFSELYSRIESNKNKKDIAKLRTLIDDNFKKKIIGYIDPSLYSSENFLYCTSHPHIHMNLWSNIPGKTWPHEDSDLPWEPLPRGNWGWLNPEEFLPMIGHPIPMFNSINEANNSNQE